MQLFYKPNIDSDVFSLTEEESRHAVKVLRKGFGDIIHVVDGVGSMYECSVVEPHHKNCVVSVVSRESHEPLPYSLHIAIAPTKNIDRVEWFLEKATEIGVSTVTLLRTEHSERKTVNLDRLEKVVVSAMKQSLKTYKPIINPLMSVSDFVGQDFGAAEKYIAHCEEGTPRVHLKNQLGASREVLVMIGPEGDFSPSEITKSLEAGFTPVTLGESRLRTETAAVFVTAAINLKFE